MGLRPLLGLFYIVRPQQIIINSFGRLPTPIMSKSAMKPAFHQGLGLAPMLSRVDKIGHGTRFAACANRARFVQSGPAIDGVK